MVSDHELPWTAMVYHGHITMNYKLGLEVGLFIYVESGINTEISYPYPHKIEVP